MYRLKERPPVSAMEYIVSHVETFKAAHRDEHFDSLAVRAAIFRTINGAPHLLLLHRANHDSLPGCWEFPGGGVENDDASLQAALYREIKEECGLTAAWVVQEIGHGERWQTKRSLSALCVSFLVEVEEVELLERGLVEGDGKSVKVTLSADEHQDYIWISEADLEAGNSSGRGEMRFTSAAMRAVMDEAFELQHEVLAAKRSVAETAAAQAAVKDSSELVAHQ